MSNIRGEIAVALGVFHPRATMRLFEVIQGVGQLRVSLNAPLRRVDGEPIISGTDTVGQRTEDLKGIGNSRALHFRASFSKCNLIVFGDLANRHRTDADSGRSHVSAPVLHNL